MKRYLIVALACLVLIPACAKLEPASAPAVRSMSTTARQQTLRIHSPASM